MTCQYVGLDVHKSTTVMAVVGDGGEVLRESMIETTEESLIAAIQGVSNRRGRTEVTFEETSLASWLYEICQPHADNVLVCHPTDVTTSRGSKTDKKDAIKLAKRLRMGELTEVEHGPEIDTPLKQLVDGYSQTTKSLVRVKNQIQSAFYRQNIKADGSALYSPQRRQTWLEKVNSEALQTQIRQLYERLDLLKEHKSKLKSKMVSVASSRHGYKSIRSIPGIGEIRTSQLMGIIGTPYRFQTKEKLWKYSCLAVVVSDSGQYKATSQGFVRKQYTSTLGLNNDGNSTLKDIFIGAAKTAIRQYPEVKEDYQARCESKDAGLARIDIARKLASQVLTLWKRKEVYDKDKACWKTLMSPECA